jgi:hypothetical protein
MGSAFVRVLATVTFSLTTASCSQNTTPSTGDVRRVFESVYAKQISAGQLKIHNFYVSEVHQETLGGPGTQTLKGMYEVNWTAQLEYPSGVSPECVNFSGGIMSPCFMALNSGLKPKMVGQFDEETGRWTIIRSQQGWELFGDSGVHSISTKDQVQQGLAVLLQFKRGVMEHFAQAGVWAQSLQEMGIDSSFISSIGKTMSPILDERIIQEIDVKAGQLTLTFSALALPPAAGRTIVVTPWIDSTRAIYWSCGFSDVSRKYPTAMRSQALNQDNPTTLSREYLPDDCSAR